MSALERELGALFGERLAVNAPLAEFTSFRIGGPADLLITVESESELMAAMALACRHDVPAFCLGAGTNLLVSDRGIRGLVVRLGMGFNFVKIDDVQVRAGAGAAFGALVEKVVANGLTGLEFGEGIPGTVGGGLVMNAGAFGGEMARVVTCVHGVTGRGRCARSTRTRSGLPIGAPIFRPDLSLRGSTSSSVRVIATRCSPRSRSCAPSVTRASPAGIPNAGSIFKNPPGNFAGQLLESAGLKGTRLGGAAFSDRHANFIVNLGGARAAEVRSLIELARDKVKQSSGVALEPEVKLVGEW